MPIPKTNRSVYDYYMMVWTKSKLNVNTSTHNLG